MIPAVREPESMPSPILPDARLDELAQDGARTALASKQVPAHAERLLAEETRARLGPFLACVAPPASTDELEHLPVRANGLFELDAKAAEGLRDAGISESQVKAFEDNIVTAAGRLDRWKDPVYPARVLAKALWWDRVRERAARHEDLGVPAVPAVVSIALRRAFFTRGRRLVDEPALPRLQLVGPIGETVGFVEREVLAELARRRGCDSTQALDLDATATLAGQRLLRFVVTRAFEGIGSASEFSIDVTGGMLALREATGSVSNKDTATLRDALDVFATVRVPLVDGDDHVLAWSEQRPGPGRAGVVRLQALAPLRPHFVGTIEKHRAEKRRLVPMPTRLPPLVGDRRTHAAQVLLQHLVLEEFAAQSRALPESGGIELPLVRWGELAREAGVQFAELGRVREAWTAGEGAFLTAKGPDRFALGEAFRRESDFLWAGGEVRLLSQQRASSAHQAKRKRIREKAS